jgi:hypothetical protein
LVLYDELQKYVTKKGYWLDVNNYKF